MARPRLTRAWPWILLLALARRSTSGIRVIHYPRRQRTRASTRASAWLSIRGCVAMHMPVGVYRFHPCTRIRPGPMHDRPAAAAHDASDVGGETAQAPWRPVRCRPLPREDTEAAPLALLTAPGL